MTHRAPADRKFATTAPRLCASTKPGALHGDDLAQPLVVGVVVVQMMDRRIMLACSTWPGWTGAVEREVSQRRELGSDAVYQGAVPGDKKWA
jgi:hypothetical protein